MPFWGYEWRKKTWKPHNWTKKSLLPCSALCVQGCTSCIFSPTQSHCSPLRLQEVVFMHWSLRWSRTAYSEGWRAYSSRQWKRGTWWKGKWEFGGINNPDGGLLSHSYRAKILIKLCILTVIAEHFFVFERVSVFIPVCMRGCVCTDVSFSHLFSALILDLQ